MTVFRPTHPSIDILEAVLQETASVYVAPCKRVRRYLQFGAKLGRNIDLHTATNTAEEDLKGSRAAQDMERRVGVRSSLGERLGRTAWAAIHEPNWRGDGRSFLAPRGCLKRPSGTCRAWTPHLAIIECALLSKQIPYPPP